MKYQSIILFIGFALFSCTEELVYVSNNKNETNVPTGDLELTVDVPGTLRSLLPDNYLQISALTLDGTINGTDLITIREMCGADAYGNETQGSLTTLDLEELTIVEGGDAYFYYEGDGGMVLKNNSISRYAFGYCGKLEEIVLPRNLVYIGPQAFYNCVSLKEVKVPETVKTIGRSAFAYCGNLSKATIPNSITVFDDFLFYCCYRLKELIFSKNVSQIGYGTFYACSLLNGLETCFERLESFEGYAFAHTRVSSFKIPSTMSYIPEGAFYDCYKLTYVNIDEGIDSISAYAFYNCSLEGKLKLPRTLKFVGEGAFYGNDITSVTIQSDIRSDMVDMLEYDAFGYNENLCSVEICEGCSFLELGFSSSKSLNRILFPSTLKRIGRDGIIDGIGYLFSHCEALSEINIPDSVEYIASGTFYGCISLKEVVLPRSLKYTGAYVFSGCSNLQSITFQSKFRTIPQGFFCDCTSLSNFEFPSELESIGFKSFLNCKSLKELSFPDSLKVISDCAFKGCSSVDNLRIPMSVDSIGVEAFQNCSSLSSVTFEGELYEIPLSCFASCSNLSSISWPGNLGRINGYAFSNCGMLTDLRIPDGVVTLGEKAFYNNRSLESLELPSTVSSIGGYCFEDCIQIKKIAVNHQVPLVIDGTIFSGIDSYNTTVVVPKGTLYAYQQAPIWKDFNVVE